MSSLSLREQLLQSDSEEASEIFNEFLSGAARLALLELMQEEVHRLCGAPYHPSQSDHHRAGSEKGVCYIGGRKQPIQRPRVRRVLDNGEEREVPLRSYQAARQVGNIREEVAALLLEGVSTRGASRLSEASVGKSTVSRQWTAKAAEKLEELRSRPLAEEGYLVLMLDGVHLNAELTAIVALGIREDGTKEMLDFKVGSSESFELANDLIKGLKKRGLKSRAKRFLSVIDGSDALEKALHRHFPTAVIQRCLVHKERNLHTYLAKRHHAELSRLFKRLRRAQGKEAAKSAYGELYVFLESHNAAAQESLKEAGQKLTSLQNLGVPATLHRTLLSTNAIENAILNIRRRMSKVNRWRADTKMADRYLACGILYAETTFRRIVGCDDLPKLREALDID